MTSKQSSINFMRTVTRRIAIHLSILIACLFVIFLISAKVATHEARLPSISLKTESVFAKSDWTRKRFLAL